MEEEKSSAPSNIRIHAHIADKVIDIACGEGKQNTKWLGHVAIARYDEAECRGWLQLGKDMWLLCVLRVLCVTVTWIGVPVSIKTKAGVDLGLDAIIQDVLKDGDHVEVEPSIK